MNKLSKLLLLVSGLLIFNSATYAVFSDVASNHKYYEAINYLQENEIVEGYEDGSYRPDQVVNRAEALKIILLGSNILVPEIAAQDIFPDVVHGVWYAKFAAKAKNLGIVKGDDTTGMFRPGDTINLAEILKILLETNNVELPTEFDRRPYADVPTEAWFAPYFGYADSIRLLEEDENYNVFPATKVTRGLMAQLMYQLQMKPEGYQEGESSYYGEKFHGKTTASGEVFDASGFTAAHRTLPFGTWLRVKNLENGKTVDVRINDRGPYAGDNRIIDLSKAAFEAISPLSRGIIDVSITPLTEAPSENEGENETEEETEEEPIVQANCPAADNIQFVSKTFFDNITLDSTFPNTFVASEVLTLSGQSASTKDEVSAFLAATNGDQFPFYSRADGQDNFEVNVFFPGPGEYQLGLIPGASGTSVVTDITVLEDNCLSQSTDASLGKLANLKLSVKEGETTVRWDDEHNYDLAKVIFRQGSREQVYYLYDEDEISPHYPDFEGWNKSEVTVEVQGGHLEDRSILDPGANLVWGPKTLSTFDPEVHYQYLLEPSASVISVPNTLQANKSFTVKVDPKANIDAIGQIILPSGLVEDVELTSTTHDPIVGNVGLEIYPPSVNDLRFTYTPKQTALHFIEINDEQGLAAVNIPVYAKGTYPLIPNPVELSFNETYDLSANVTALQNEMLGLVNADRADHGLPALKLDLSLSQLAQARTDDMVSRKYFGHYTPEGYTANDLRSDHAIAQFVSENVARDSNMELAQYGLMRSASHRANILAEEWKRAGFGFTTDPGNGIIFVQIFSDDPIDFANLDDLRGQIVDAVNEVRTAENLNESHALNGPAQDWSERMVDEDFFAFTAPDSTSFVDSVRDAGIDDTLGTFIIGNSSFENAIEQITDNDQIMESRWKDVGIGIKQDQFGIIKVTLLYTE